MFRSFTNKENIHLKEKNMGHTAILAIKAPSVTLAKVAKGTKTGKLANLSRQSSQRLIKSKKDENI